VIPILLASCRPLAFLRKDSYIPLSAFVGVANGPLKPGQVMQPEIANLVDRVLLCGLDLKERLARGERLDMAVEQAQLRTLLKSQSEAQRWPDYGGDNPLGATSLGGQKTAGFLGIRYALVCWLDEIFILDSPWADQWKEQALEPELYGTRLRGDEFWNQVRRAEARATPDALEGYYLCVMLGFRGQQSLDKLRAWCDAMEPRITGGYDRGYDLPPAKAPPCNVPPLVSRDKLRRLVVVGALLAALLLVLVPIMVLS
jgi:type VI secretion system protein ImpK